VPQQIAKENALAQPRFTSLPVVSTAPQDVAAQISGKTTNAPLSLPASNVVPASKLNLNLTTLLMFAWAITASCLGLRLLSREIRFPWQ